MYTALVSILAGFATLRYEIAIVLPRSKIDAIHIGILSLVISFIWVLILYGILLFWRERLEQYFGSPGFITILHLVPIAVLLSAIFQILNYWAIREGRFGSLGINSIVQSAIGNGAKITFGYISTSSINLILGGLVGQAIGNIHFLWSVRATTKGVRPRIRWIQIAENAKKYLAFPIYSTLGAICDAVAVQIALFAITGKLGIIVAGIFSMAMRLLSLPLSMVGTAVGQVLFQQIARIHNDDPGKVFGRILLFFSILLCIAVPFLIISNIWGPTLIVWILGPKWTNAANMVPLLAWVVSTRFAVSPLSKVLGLRHNVKLAFYWQASYLATSIVVLSIASNYKIDIFLRVFVIHEVVLYLAYLILILRSSRKASKK